MTKSVTIEQMKMKNIDKKIKELSIKNKILPK